MKKFLFMLILVIGILYLSDAVADDLFLTDVSIGERINLGLNCSAIIPTEDDSEVGIFAGGLLSYDILKYLAVGIEGGYAGYDIEYEDIKFGTLNSWPLLGDVILKAPMDVEDFTFTPYGVFGAGVLFSSFDESSILEAIGINIDTDTAFLMKFGSGIDFYVNDNLALNFEFSYYVVDIETDAQWGGQSFATDEVEADAWLIGGGGKIRF